MPRPNRSLKQRYIAMTFVNAITLHMLKICNAIERRFKNCFHVFYTVDDQKGYWRINQSRWGQIEKGVIKNINSDCKKGCKWSQADDDFLIRKTTGLALHCKGTTVKLDICIFSNDFGNDYQLYNHCYTAHISKIRHARRKMDKTEINKINSGTFK